MIEFLLLYFIIKTRGVMDDMTLFVKRIKLMISMYKNVKNDRYRKEELIKAFVYLAKHPHLLFVDYKQIKCNHDSVSKNVNTIVNRPYVLRIEEII